MRLQDDFLRSVCFLHRRVSSVAGDKELTPLGTACLIGSLMPDGRSRVFLLTARHVVLGARPFGEIIIRLQNEASGRVERISLDPAEWIEHSKADIALLRTAVNWDSYAIRFIPATVFASEEYIQTNNVGLGDSVFALGMLAGHVGSDCDLVVARFGHISAIPGNEIRFGNAGGVPEFSTPAYLAELQSWPGMSGAPTFVYYSVSRNILTGSSVSPPITNPAVLGLVSGHLGCRLGKSEDTLSGGEYQMVVNSGIAAIVPAHYVHELLAEAEL